MAWQDPKPEENGPPETKNDRLAPKTKAKGRIYDPRIGIFLIALATIVSTAGGPVAVQGQTKPSVTTLGPDFPKSALFIGNSFFYYNNGMHTEVLMLERGADPEGADSYRNILATIGGSGSTGTTSKAISVPMRSVPIPSTKITTSCSTSRASCSTLRS